MLCGKALAAPVFLLGCCSALWRYKTNTKNYVIINTRTTIHLEYEGPSFMEWDTPEVCVVKNKTSPKTVMYCSAQGIHNIRPRIGGKPLNSEERFIYVDRSRDCFLWYFQMSKVENEDVERIQVWVYDPESASDSELNFRAPEPSITSRTLSKQFLVMGQEPIIQSTITYKNFSPNETRQDGIWEIFVPHNKGNIFMVIKGNPVAFQDCFISNYLFLMNFKKLSLKENPKDLPLTSKSKEQTFFDWMACFPATIVIATFWECFYTENAFNTSVKIRVPPNILSDEERHSVEDICVTKNGVIFLIKGSVYIKTTNHFQKLDQEFGIPPDVRGIDTRNWCWPEFNPKEGLQLSEIVMWTRTEIYLGYNDLRFYKLISLKELLSVLDVSLHILDFTIINDVIYTAEPTEISLMLKLFLVSRQKNLLYIVFYSEESLKWTVKDFSLLIDKGIEIHMQFLYSALPSLILWDRHTVYYIYQGFSLKGYLQSTDGNKNLSTISKNSTIHQVYIDYFGNAVIKMQNNIFLYFKIDITDVAVLHEWTNENYLTSMFFNPSGEPYLVDFTGGKTKRQEYPLLMEIFSSTHMVEPACPYIMFESNIYSSNVYLDKREELTIWCQVVYNENYGLYTVVDLYGPNILSEKRSMDFEVVMGVCAKNLTVTFYQAINYESAENYRELQYNNTGHVMIQLRPSQFTKTCPLSNKALHVFVGCNPHKHISIKGYKFSPCEDENIIYVIKKEYLRNNPPEDKMVNYNTSLLGCPIKIDIKESFQPVIELYNNENFIEEVNANFILWEIYGRKDYSYNLTMGKSGCVNEAQTWQSMIKKNKHLPIAEVWGPENYRNCFSYVTGPPGEIKDFYEIFNLTNNNHLFWKNHYVGIYVFRVKIIDPNFSFCNLTTTFTIERIGIAPRPDPLLVASFLVVLIVVVIVFLIGSYFYYTKIFRNLVGETN